MHCAAPVGVELIALLIGLRGDDVEAHVLHIGFQGRLVLGVLPGDLQAVLLSTVYDGYLQEQQASSGVINFLRAIGCPIALAGRPLRTAAPTIWALCTLKSFQALLRLGG